MGEAGIRGAPKPNAPHDVPCFRGQTAVLTWTGQLERIVPVFRTGSPRTSAYTTSWKLAIDVKPAKPAFAVGEPVAFTVTFRNASNKPFMQYDAGWTLGYRITLGPWQAFRF